MSKELELNRFRELDQKPLRQATLCFLLRENDNGQEILLAMKKRGFGKGWWNGSGGKVNSDQGETIEQALQRELFEEIGVMPQRITKVAVLRFFFPLVPENQDWNQEVHVFFINEWEGEPAESEEMLPRWFGADEIPFEQMWPDDPHWLPRVLQDEKLKATFIFGEENKIEDLEIINVSEL